MHHPQNQDQVCQEFALESIGCIFLGSRLGRNHHLPHPPPHYVHHCQSLIITKGTLAGHEDGRRLIEAQTQVLGWSLPMLFLPLKVVLVADSIFTRNLKFHLEYTYSFERIMFVIFIHMIVLHPHF